MESVVWGGSITAGDKDRINRTIRRAEKVMGLTVLTTEGLYDKPSYIKAKCILTDPTHSLYSEYPFPKRLNRAIMPKISTERYRHSFIPSTTNKLSAIPITLTLQKQD